MRIQEGAAGLLGIPVLPDELNLVLGATSGETSNINAAYLLKPALAREDLRCTGATTTDEYNTHIESKERAFERRHVTRLQEHSDEKAR
jgi:ATP-dependent Clp protease ATP-binding subunit ClpA